MRIWLFSDWHIERGVVSGADLLAHGIPDADVCVAAGDVDLGVRAIELLGRNVAPLMPVIVTPGNHCYRGLHYERTRSEMAAAAAGYSGLHLLDPGTAIVDGVRFIGATLWTDFELAGASRLQESLDAARPRFHSITTGPVDDQTIWSPEDSRRSHLVEKAYIERALLVPHDGPTVVVTHHAPHPDCMHPRFLLQDRGRSAAYVSDLSSFIDRHRPDMWLHGHTHDSVDIVAYGGTRIVANPRGYHVRSFAKDGFEEVHYATDTVRRPAGHDREEFYEGPENRDFDPGLTIDMVPRSALVAA